MSLAQVSKRFNALCGGVLQAGFDKAVGWINEKKSALNARMPPYQRRSLAAWTKRRSSSLWPVYELVMKLKRITERLDSVYTPYITRRVCFFIPGQVDIIILNANFDPACIIYNKCYTMVNKL